VIKGYPKMLQKKFGDYLSISSVVEDVLMFFYFYLKQPPKGANQFNMSKLDKSLPNYATDKVW
jgi:hypothetical protein